MDEIAWEIEARGQGEPAMGEGSGSRGELAQRATPPAPADARIWEHRSNEMTEVIRLQPGASGIGSE